MKNEGKLQNNYGKLQNNYYSELQNIFDLSYWSLITNEVHKIINRSKNNPFEEFRITIYEHKIETSVPMPNSTVLYKTTFENKTDVIEYIRNQYSYLNESKEVTEDEDSI